MPSKAAWPMRGGFGVKNEFWGSLRMEDRWEANLHGQFQCIFGLLKNSEPCFFLRQCLESCASSGMILRCSPD